MATPNEPKTDEQLIQLYRDGNTHALDILIRRHEQQVYTAIYLLVNNEATANDLFQDTFVKIIDALQSGKYKETGQFKAWIMRVARNLTMDYFRKGTRGQKHISNIPVDSKLESTIGDNSTTKIDLMVKSDQKNQVRSLIELLPPEQQQVILLRHYFNMSFKEIADLCGVSINTALGRMRYGLINLRKMVNNDMAKLS